MGRKWTPEQKAAQSKRISAYWRKKKALESSQTAVEEPRKAITPEETDTYSVSFIGRLLAWVGFSR